MNVYWLHCRYSEGGCIVAAETTGKAKAMYARWDGMENFTEYRASILRHDVVIPKGIYDENCPELEKIGLEYEAEELNDQLFY